MFGHKKHNQDSGLRASFDLDREDELILDLKKRKKSRSPERHSPDPGKGRKWSVSLRSPWGGWRIFGSGKDKGVEFVKNFEREEKESLGKRILSLFSHSFFLLKITLKVGTGVLSLGFGLFKRVLSASKNINKLNPFKRAFLLLFRKKGAKKKRLFSRQRKDKSTRQKKDKNKDRKEAFGENISYPVGFISRSLLSFFVLLILLTLPFKLLDYYTSFDLTELKEGVTGSSKEAFSNFKTAARALSDMDTSEAGENFSKANMNLLRAQEQIEDINDILLELSRFAPQEEVRLASISEEVLTAARAASQLGENLTLAFDVLLEFESGEEGAKDPLATLDKFQSRLEKSLKNAEDIKTNISKIDPEILPDEYRDDFISLRKKVDFLEKGLSELVVLTQRAKIFLGEDSYKKRYLLVFQNSNEIRASGGFIGSFAEVTFKDGELVDIRVPEGGSYDLDGGMKELITSPKPLQLISARWSFRDANWWPDWPTSAENLIRFYEKSGGNTVDGCIAVTPEVLGEVLQVTGPLDMRDEYGIIVDEDNFWTVIREQIEEEKESDKPKEIIGDLTQRIKEELSDDLDRKKVVDLLGGLQGSMEAKDVQFYFSDPELQKEVATRGWAGKIKDTDKDYLAVVNSNIGGQKSDKNIKQSITHRADIREDGSIIDTVTINRMHQGDEEEEKYYRARNVNWMRVYVPEGSELLQARGFEAPSEKFFEEPGDDWKKHSLLEQQQEEMEYHRPSGTGIYSEKNKTVFANWSILDPGETETIELKYRLPFKFKKEELEPQGWWESIKDSLSPSREQYHTYSLLTQRQAGSDRSEINSVVRWPDTFEPVWNYPEDMSFGKKSWFISDTLNRDKYWVSIFK